MPPPDCRTTGCSPVSADFRTRCGQAAQCPMTVAEAEPFRRRAAALRRSAAMLHASRAAELGQRAGADTWVGPTPQRCGDDLLQIRRLLREAHDDLAGAARALDHEADRIEVMPAVLGAR